MRNFGLIALVAALGCGSSGSGGSTNASSVPLMAGFDPGPAPATGTGFQVILPIVKNVQAGGSYEYCSWTNVTLTHDVWVKSSQGKQSETGHHVVVFYTTTPQPAGLSRICNDSDMASFRFAITGTGEGADETNTLPGNLAVKIPAGAQIVINHHYLNASTSNVAEAQSAVNVSYDAPGATPTLASSVAFVDTAMSIAPGLGSVDFTCKVNNSFATWYFIPHMHNWGQHITVDHISGASTNRLFDLDWDPNYAFHPPTMTEDPTKPYMLNAGDQIHVHCDYNNTTNAALTFGAEMCVAFAQTVDTSNVGNLACDTGSWGPF